MNPLGRIINRLSNDVLVIDLNIPWYYHVIQEDLVKVLGILVVVSIIFPWIVIIIGFFLMLVWRLIKIYRPVNRDMKRLNSVN
jgi:ABC-type multidrug transport system fused ATPase/permease subunit